MIGRPRVAAYAVCIIVLVSLLGWLWLRHTERERACAHSRCPEGTWPATLYGKAECWCLLPATPSAGGTP